MANMRISQKFKFFKERQEVSQTTGRLIVSMGEELDEVNFQIGSQLLSTQDRFFYLNERIRIYSFYTTLATAVLGINNIGPAGQVTPRIGQF